MSNLQKPEAKNVEVLDKGLREYSFRDRFSKPDWIESLDASVKTMRVETSKGVN